MSGMTTTTRLLARLHEPADEAVWREFDGRYRPIIAGLAQRLGLGGEEAADVAQETLARFVDAYRAGKYDRTRGKLRSWILGIARHVAADACAARAANRKRRGESAFREVPDMRRLTKIWDAERRAAILAQAFRRMRETTRLREHSIRACEMVVFEGRAPDNVASELGMTRHDVYVAKHRVTGRLRKIVAEIETLYDGDD